MAKFLEQKEHTNDVHLILPRLKVYRAEALGGQYPPQTQTTFIWDLRANGHHGHQCGKQNAPFHVRNRIGHRVYLWLQTESMKKSKGQNALMKRCYTSLTGGRRIQRYSVCVDLVYWSIPA